MPSSEDVLEWKLDAQRTLERAQQLSSKANDQLQEASHILNDKLLAKLNEATTQIEEIKHKYNQVQLQYEDLKRLGADFTNGYKKLTEKNLNPALLQLEEVLKSLEEIEVPSFLIPAEEGNIHHLSDFVSWLELDLLRTNINIYQKNCNKVFQLLQRKTRELKDQLHTGSLTYSSTVKLYDSKVAEVKVLMNEAINRPSPKNKSNLIHTLLKENNSLENELASVLKMLTNHFDQCCLAAQWNSTADEESLTVLQEDSRELPSVLKEVDAIHDIIEHNCVRANQFVEQKIPPIEEVLSQCEEWQQWFERFSKEGIVEMLLLILACQQIVSQSSLLQLTSENQEGIKGAKTEKDQRLGVSPILEYAEVLNQLCHHYKQFKSVYETKYLSELYREQYVYPREFLKQLDTYLNVQLLKMDAEEREKRRAWLQKYGDFIPRQFYLPGELNQPQVIQVVSDGLDEFEAEDSKEKEAQLLLLIQEFRVS